MSVDRIQEPPDAHAVALRAGSCVGVARTECQAGEVVPSLLGQDAQVHRGDGCDRPLPRREVPIAAVQEHVDQVEMAVRARPSMDGQATSR